MSGFLAVDWGTTRLRCWRVDADGRPGPRRDFPLGVGALAPGEAERRFRAEVRPAMGAEALPAVMAGMVGSTLGWRAAPYLDCPAAVADLARGMLRIEGQGAPTAIAPGLRCLRPDGAPDVMRGEEVQIMGWIAADPARGRGRRLVCLPGTHAKWARVEDGRVTAFLTFMTGELFDRLSTGGVLRTDPAQASDPGGAAFDLGLATAEAGGPLSSLLFTARSRVVGGDLPAAAARAYLSGLLVGAEVAEGPRALGFSPDAPVVLVGEPGLADLYRRALARRGAPTEVVDGDEAVLAGLRALFAADTEMQA